MSNTQLCETRSQASPQRRRSAFANEDQYSPQENVVFDPDAWLYRERTVALLRRYLRISIEVGRLPSLLGRELFRSKVTSYRMSSFEDGVIFVHDVEQALDQLSEFPRQLIATIVFQEYTQEEAAEVLRCGRRTVCREFPAALDRITEIFLEGGLLNYLPMPPVEKTCQEVNEGDF
jgi:DNA-directed RNA polymerase specialized sigma24 family protein